MSPEEALPHSYPGFMRLVMKEKLCDCHHALRDLRLTPTRLMLFHSLCFGPLMPVTLTFPIASEARKLY